MTGPAQVEVFVEGTAPNRWLSVRIRRRAPNGGINATSFNTAEGQYTERDIVELIRDAAQREPTDEELELIRRMVRGDAP